MCWWPRALCVGRKRPRGGGCASGGSHQRGARRGGRVSTSMRLREWAGRPKLPGTVDAFHGGARLRGVPWARRGFEWTPGVREHGGGDRPAVCHVGARKELPDSSSSVPSSPKDGTGRRSRFPSRAASRASLKVIVRLKTASFLGGFLGDGVGCARHRTLGRDTGEAETKAPGGCPWLRPGVRRMCLRLTRWLPEAPPRVTRRSLSACGVHAPPSVVRLFVPGPCDSAVADDPRLRQWPEASVCAALCASDGLSVFQSLVLTASYRAPPCARNTVALDGGPERPGPHSAAPGGVPRG